MMLWPQACPMPGRASYSAQMAIDQRAGAGSRPRRRWAGRPAAGRRRTRRRPGARHVQAQARSSSNATSGWAWMAWLRSTSPARRSSIA